MLHVPNAVKSRLGHGTLLSRNLALKVREEPAAVDRNNKVVESVRRWYWRLTPPIVGAKRLRASALDPLSMGGPLYQSRAVPEGTWPPPEHVRRAETRNCNWAPGGRDAGPFVSARLIVFSMLLLKSPVGIPTLSSSPVPTGVPLIKTSAFKSSFSPVSLLVARPSQIFAGESAVNNLGAGVGVFVAVFIGVGVLVEMFVGVRVGVFVGVLGVLVGVGVGVFVGVVVRVLVGVSVGVGVFVVAFVGV